MQKMNLKKCLAVFLCGLGLFAMGVPTRAMAVERTALADTDKYAVLAPILSFHRLEYAPGGPVVKIYTVGGGDPAMNGAFIYVAIEHIENTMVWETELNVHHIKKISFTPGNTIRIEVDQDFMDKNSSIVSRKKRLYSR